VTELIDRIFEEGWALEIAQSGCHGEQAAANLLKLRRMAEEREARSGDTLREFLDVAARAVRDLEEEGESPLADESLDAVRILSIHRSKGLEFPVVILPDLHRGAANARPPVAAYDRPSRTLGVRLGDVMNAGGAALAHLERERRREEQRRLLYVAVTRAEDRLVLLGSGEGRGETYLSMLLPDLEKRAALERKPYARPPYRPAPAPAEPEKPDWKSFAAAWKRRAARAAAVERYTTPTKLERSEAALSAGEPSAAADVGSACHRVLERLDFAAPSIPAGTDPEAAAILEGFFKSKAFAELSESEILARELPFVLEKGGRVIQGVIDVVYRSGGKLYVADWKTDKILKPEEYRVSGELYAEAVKRALGEAPRFRLVDLRKGRVVDVRG
jgi:ATP-dependent helicase/nuclease subunit A